MKKELKTKTGPRVNDPRKIPNPVRALFPDHASIFIRNNHWVAEWEDIEPSAPEVVPMPTIKSTGPEDLTGVNLGELAKVDEVRAIAYQLETQTRRNDELENLVNTMAGSISSIATKCNTLTQRNESLETTLLRVHEGMKKLDQQDYNTTTNLVELAYTVFNLANKKKPKEQAVRAYELTKLRPKIEETE